MFSANYSLNCTTFDPKGKILQVRAPSRFLTAVTVRAD